MERSARFMPLYVLLAPPGIFSGHPWPSTRHKTTDRRDERDKQHFQVIKKDGINDHGQLEWDIRESDVGLAPENVPNFHVFLGPSGRPVVGSRGLFLENGAKLRGCVHLHLLQHANHTIQLLGFPIKIITRATRCHPDHTNTGCQALGEPLPHSAHLRQHSKVCKVIKFIEEFSSKYELFETIARKNAQH
ncbi:hypothetical protein EDB80DRAFT_685881 [Ilyonectria destructans]|nr:hypothetical protein EDB80DRAFT_685881 [Ilyonectria destructans]